MGRAALFPLLQTGGMHFDAGERLTLRRDAYRYALTDAQGLTYRFVAPRGRAVQPLGSPPSPASCCTLTSCFVVAATRAKRAQAFGHGNAALRVVGKPASAIVLEDRR